ncbi:hypothetical protein HDU96_000127, partial [Phlyctochytrium bullatum]
EWRQKFAAAIAERDARAEKKHQETLQLAKESLERFYADYNEKKARAIAKNKELEESLRSSDEGSSTGNVWERVVKQIELSSVSSVNQARVAKTGKSDGTEKKDDKPKKALAKTKDTSRMKSLLLSLKNDKKATVVV